VEEGALMLWPPRLEAECRLRAFVDRISVRALYGAMKRLAAEGLLWEAAASAGETGLPVSSIRSPRKDAAAPLKCAAACDSRAEP
jgi:hypothetical protein